MGTVKDRKSTDLTEADEIKKKWHYNKKKKKKKWQQYTEKLYKVDRNDIDNHDGMITHLEPDILECEDKWVLGSITTNKAKASGNDGLPAELFQIL